MKALSVLLSGAILVGSASASVITIRRDSILEGVVETELNLKKSREGDTFEVTLRKDRELPDRTRVLGTVTRIENARRDRAAYAEIEFDVLVLPNGERTRINAVPVALNSKGIRERDGRIVLDKPQGPKPEVAVLGGAIGGLIIGSILKKPGEGLFAGVLAGILVGEASKANKDVIIQRGSKVGVLLQEDVRIDDQSWNRDRDDRDWDRDRDQDRDRDRDRDRDQDRDTREAVIEANGRQIFFERGQEPFYKGGTLMVPMDTMAGRMSLKVDRREERIYIDSKDSTLRLELGSRDYRLNGKRGEMAVEPEERGGVVYVPIEVFAPLTRDLKVNGSSVSNL